MQGVQGYSLYTSWYLCFMLEWSVCAVLVSIVLSTGLFNSNMVGSFFLILFAQLMYGSVCWALAFLFRYVCAGPCVIARSPVHDDSMSASLYCSKP